MTQDSIKKNFNGKQFTIWLGAIIIGCFLGSLGYPKLNEFFNFIARIYTRLFQFLAVPTIALALMTTLAQLGAKKNTGKIFLHTITYTLLTTLAASVVGACLYKIIAPENLPAEIISEGQNQIAQTGTSYYEHILSVIPNNIIAPIAENNVLSILIVSAAIGLAIAHLKNSENVQVLHKGIIGLQEMFFVLISRGWY